MHFINSPECRSSIAEQAGGTTRQRIAGGRLKALEMPVPPAPEQRRIVAKIDSLSEKSKRARERLDHVPRLVDRYRQAVLGAAFHGQLTATWGAANHQPPWSKVDVRRVQNLITEISFRVRDPMC
jgi:type I restriction enzyme S subunit